MSHPILTEAAARMKKAVDHTLHEFSAIHTGKATPAMIESVTVEAYGSMVPLKQCAAISTPDARLIQIQPWDISLVKAITKGIIALVLLTVQDQAPAAIRGADIEGALAPFDLGNQLSSNRTQGIPNMIALIRATAERYAG